MDHILLFSACIIPSLILLWYVYMKDKVEKEPFYLLALLLLGGVVSCVISVLVSLLFKRYLPFLNLAYSEMNLWQILFKVFFTIVIIEEGSKWVISYIVMWHNKNFKHLYDPIVYSSFVALGFATLENILYGITYSSQGLSLIIMRGIVSVPSHAVCGIFMGYYFAISKNAFLFNKKNRSLYYRLLSFVIPVCLHFFYNLLLIGNHLITNSLFVVYIIVLYVIAYQKIHRLSSINKNLPIRKKEFF